MANEIHPLTAPSPNAGLIYDGSDFRVPLGDTAGRQIVRGEDQLFSIKSIWQDQDNIPNADAGVNNLTVGPVPEGEIWVAMMVFCYDITSSPTRIYIGSYDGTNYYHFNSMTAPAQSEGPILQGGFYLDEGNYVGGVVIGATAGDNLYLQVNGYKMTVES